MSEENMNAVPSEEQNRIEALEKQLETATRINAELQAQVEEKVKASPLKLVKHGKDTYRQVIPKFLLEGKEYTYDSLSGNKELIARLVKMGSGVLEKVEE